MDILLFELPTASENEATKLQPLLDGLTNIVEWEIEAHAIHCLLIIKGIGVKALDIMGQLKKHGIPVTQVFGE